MTGRPFVPGSRVASRLGLTERVFAGARSRRLMRTVEDGLARVEDDLAGELRVSDPLVDATSRYLYEAGGKRVRPMLVLLTCQLGDGVTDDVIHAATALELTHLGSLYHDDVMDDADVRRGVPAAHSVWGNSIAILTGDLLFARASQIMARLGERAIRLQADTFERLVLGQMHETIGAQPGDDPVAFYLQVLKDKTGSLIAAAAQAGILFGNAPAEYEQAMFDFGEKTGVAFQLLDDVIDLSDDPGETGKVPGTDLRAGVPTMPYLLLGEREDAASTALRRQIDDGVAEIAAGADPAILDGALASLRDHDATAQTRALAHSWSRDAVDALSPVPDGPVREGLARFAEAVADRSS
ncbi:polyprenyl synthetase family protein [Microbacterium protaetiae]|uniref:Polyprenyl synthetase family protein n=1 Tax=Microbacterium protaetiae TaxID=2509458 RepID=A0A4P6EDU0_9MICO|nr:polyprenyl synthetase family protein [Microbacterium protaetiae]QAY60450.1 polyprenyl synthetase family protein [Microbacterium protaetiae]